MKSIRLKKIVGSISAALSGPRASPRRDLFEGGGGEGVSAALFPETAAGNRA